MLLAVLLPASAFAAKRLNFTNYQTEQGLSSNYVADLSLGDDGFLWIATDYGLNRFDGAVFRSFLTETYPSLGRNDMLQVKATPAGDVIVSGYNGFFQRYNPKTDLFDSIFPGNYYETVSRLYFGHGRKEVYAIASDGLYVQRGASGAFQTGFLPGAGNMGNVKCIMGDEFGHYWLALPDRMSIRDANGGVLQEFLYPAGSSANSIAVLLDLHTGRVLAGCQNRQLDFYHISPTGKVAHERSLALPFANLVDVQVASDGSFWFASDGDGLWMSAAEPRTAADIQHVLPYGADGDELAKVYALLTDGKGNVWAGTQNSGLWHYSVINKSSAFTSADLGLPHCLMHGFCQLPSGNILAACDGKGLCEFSEHAGLVGCKGAAQGLSNLNTTGVACLPGGGVWATAWGGGLYEGKVGGAGLRFAPEGMNNAFRPLNTMSHIGAMPNGEVWVCVGGEGLYCRKPSGAWERYILRYPDNQQEFERWPSFCFQGGNGEVWVSSSFAMWTNRGGSFRPFDMGRFIGNVDYVVNDGVGLPGYGVVLATRSGLLVARNGDSVFHELDICPKKEVVSVVADGRQRLWAVVANAIWCFDLKANTARRYPHDFDARGRNFFLKHSKFCSESGRIYFGTKDGFFSFNTEGFDAPAPKADLYLSHLEMDGQLVKVPPLHKNESLLQAKVPTLKLPYGHSSFAVSVDMPDFTPNRPALVYRLNANDWIPLGPDQRIAHSYLPQGEYLLEVKTLEADAAAALQLRLVVEGPWWTSWWFRLLLAAAIIALAGWKLYALNRDRRVLKAMVDERTRELKLKSELVEHRNGELNAALAMKDRLMAVVAHDLKNPVFAIVGALEGLRKRCGKISETEQVALLDNMIARSQTLQAELSKLLVWATSSQGEMEFRPANTDLADVIESDVQLTRMQAESKGVGLHCEVALPCFSYADARMVSSAIRNVIGNSIKFTPAGKNVNVRAWQAGGQTIVEIADQGVGLTPDKINELLHNEVNSSSSGTGGEKGTGLGVGLAKHYVTANGGNFFMESKVGEGTTTRMVFPATNVPVVRTTIAQTGSDVGFVADSELLQGNTVLVADDDPLIAQHVKAMLEGYVDVLVAQNGEEALDVAHNHTVDIVVSDVEMPVMNGIELSNKLAADPATNHIPVLFLSAKTGESDRLLGLLTGAVDYIPKPFNQSELLIKLNNILALRQRQQQRLLEQGVAGGTDAKPQQSVAETEETTAGEKMNPFLQQVLADIQLHYAQADYGVEQMAANLFTTRITLYRKVKSLSGQNPSDWLNDFRLNKAEQLLKAGNMPLQDVAFAVGFSDHAYFARRFKARFGLSPKDVWGKQ